MTTSLAQGILGSHSYTDLAGLNRIRAGAKNHHADAVADIGRQFESMFIRMVLKSMREANTVFSEGNFLNSSETQFRQNMLDDQLSLSLTQGQGIGLASSLVKQLEQQFFAANEATAEEGSAEEEQDVTVAPLDDSQLNTSLQQYYERRHRPINALPVAQPIMAKPIAAQPVSAPLPAVDQQFPKEAVSFASATDFVQQLLPYAKQVAEKLGVTPRVILAQAALETGWGKSLARQAPRSSYNLFNIKSDPGWKGDSVVVSTLENKDGIMTRERASFRAYQSFADSFDDYANFLQGNPRYQDALANASNPQAFISGLQRAGYATDPNYANKILSVMQNDPIRQVPLR